MELTPAGEFVSSILECILEASDCNCDLVKRADGGRTKRDHFALLLAMTCGCNMQKAK